MFATSLVKPNAERVCAFMIAVGVILQVFAFFNHEFHLPTNLTTKIWLNTICTVESAALYSTALFFSVKNVMTTPVQRKAHFAGAVGASILLLLLFFLFYFQYLFITQMLNKITTSPSAFPQLVEVSEHFPGSPRQTLAAQLAYEMYGIRLAYYPTSGQSIYYDPPPDVREVRQKTEELNASIAKVRQISLGLFAGVADIVLTVFISFLVCLCWETFRSSPKVVTSTAPTEQPVL